MKTSYSEDENSRKIVDFLGIDEGQKANHDHVKDLEKWLNDKDLHLPIEALLYGDNALMRSSFITELNS